MMAQASAIITISSSRLLLILALCWFHTCLVQARTVREQGDEPDKQDDHHWGRELSDMEGDFWPILCPPDSWFSKKQHQCRNCTLCPDDHFVTRPCYRFHDTKCTPLNELPKEFLRPSNTGHSQPLAEDAAAAEDNLLKHGGRRGSRKSEEDQWRPAAVVLIVITGVLVLALLVTSVAVCVVWRRQREEEPPKTTTMKLVCSYSPAPSQTV